MRSSDVFEDRRPVEWPRAHALGTTRSTGTGRVCANQTDVDWDAARDSGISLRLHQATEGGEPCSANPIVPKQQLGAAAARAGIPRSAYHFSSISCRPASVRRATLVHPERPARCERVAPRSRHGMEPPLADLTACRPPADEVQSEMKIFLDALERHYGKAGPSSTPPVDLYRDNPVAKGSGRLRLLAALPFAAITSFARHPRRVANKKLIKFIYYIF